MAMLLRSLPLLLALDIVLVLSDKERDALVLSLGVVMQAQPQLAPNVIGLFNKVLAAPTMVEPTLPAAPPKKDDSP